MSSISTKPGTECYYGLLQQEAQLEFKIRKVRPVNRFQQKAFHSQDRFPEEDIMTGLLRVQQEHQVELLPKLEARKKQSWKDKVNRKRALIKKCIQNQACLNLAAVARFTKSCPKTVKAIHRQLVCLGDAVSFEYNNLKDSEEQEALDKSIGSIEEGFQTVSDLKRSHPTFSKKKILERMHSMGYRYRLLPKERKNPEQRVINSTRVCRVISHIAQAICDPNTEVLYCDEMKFPLYQTAEKRWTHVYSQPSEAIVYNRRPALTGSLTAIALCSLHKFEAVQLYSHEVTGADFLYFLNEAIAHLPADKHYTIIADNATWHHASVVSSAKASRFLFFNEPKMFQLNIIENAFSFVRFDFRKRPIVHTLEEEAKSILQIFFDPANPERFKGLFRNHLRMLIEFLERHRPK